MKETGKIVAEIYSKKWNRYIKYMHTCLFLLLIGAAIFMFTFIFIIDEIISILILSPGLVSIIIFIFLTILDFRNEPVVLFESAIKPHILNFKILKFGRREIIPFDEIDSIEYEDFPDEWIVCTIKSKKRSNNGKEKYFYVDNATDLNLIMKTFNNYKEQMINNYE